MAAEERRLPLLPLLLSLVFWPVDSLEKLNRCFLPGEVGEVGDAIVVLRPISRVSVSGAEGGGGRFASRCADDEAGRSEARQRKHSPVP